MTATEELRYTPALHRADNPACVKLSSQWVSAPSYESLLLLKV
jgi:hypothetical protein